MSSSLHATRNSLYLDAQSVPIHPFDAIPDIVVRLDRDLRHVLVNRAIEPIIGRTAASLVGKTLAQAAIPEPYLSQWTGALQRVFTDARPQEHSFSFPTRVGLRQFHVRLTPEASDSGRTETVLAVARDVTDLIANVDTLFESEERFRSTFDTSGVAIALVTTDCRWMHVNESMCDMLGYSREELTSTEFLRITHPDDVAASRLLVEQLRAGTHRAVHREKRYIHKDGHIVWVQIHVAVVRDRSGRTLYWVTQAQDITERKRAEAALRESEERFRLVVEHALDITVLLDAAGYMRYVSPSAERVLGRAVADLVGTLAFSLIHPDDQTSAVDALSRLTDPSDAPEAVAVRVLHADGRWLDVEAVGRAVVGEGGNVTEVVVNLRDVTERRQLEQQLRRAQQMEAVGRLAAGIAHDVNNVLAIVSANCEFLLADLPRDTGSAGDVREIQSALGRATQLTRQLLTFGQRKVTRALPIDVNAVVSGLERMLASAVGDSASLVLDLAPDIGTVSMDPGQLEQVLMNLALNARDAMPAGGTVTVRTANVRGRFRSSQPPSGAAAPCVLLSVSDTGAGISPEVLPRIFEPFFTTKQAGSGSGLGLATVYGIVTQAAGEVTVESVPGRGAAFRILLPSVGLAPAVTVPPKAVAPSPGGEAILLVEDEDEVRIALRRMLERAGYSVREARNGAEALHFCTRVYASVDLVLTDVAMPVMCGVELRERLSLARPGVKVLLMSGNMSEVRQRARPVPPDAAFLEKPFSSAALTGKIRSLLDREHVG